jgi:hypothetical protein
MGIALTILLVILLWVAAVVLAKDSRDDAKERPAPAQWPAMHRHPPSTSE